MKNFIYLFLLICCCCTRKQNNSDDNIGINPTYQNNIKDKNDISITNLNKLVYDTIVRNQYSQLADHYQARQQFQKLKEVSQIIDQKSTIIKDTFGMIKGRANLGAYYLNYSINDSSFYYFTKAEKLSKKIKGNPFLLSILYHKAILYWYQKDFMESEKIGVEALKLAIVKKDKTLIYSSYVIIANSLEGMNDDEKAIKYYNEALQVVEELKNEPQYLTFNAQLYNYIAKVYQKKKQYQKAIDYIKNNVDLNQVKKENSSLYCYLINNVGYSKFKLGDTSSFNQFNETLEIAKKNKNISIQLTSKSHLGEYYLSQKDTIKAKYYLIDGWNQAQKSKIFDDELKLLQLLILANPDNSSYYSKRYISLNDSLQNIERSARGKFARLEYETDEIIKQKQIVEEEKDTLFTRLILMSGFALLTLLLIVLWFKNQSQKAKTKQLLLEQEHQKDKEEIYQLMLAQQQKIEEGKQLEKRRISQELHDGVMGKLSSIRMNLFVLNKKSDPETIAQCLTYIKDIQTIEKEIRTISHELNSNLFSDNVNFVSIVENLFTAIKNHSDIRFHLKVDEQIDWETVNNNIKINIYRIIQEALQNIDKYAKAQNVFIAMDKKDEHITIEIKDDGVGFDIESEVNGIGLSNMKARMQEINGEFNIESKPKSGTKINLIIRN